MKALVWLALAVLIGAYICLPVADPDLWWHITVGRWIITHGEVPHVDHWNTFAAGLPWRAYSWSNEIVLALVDGWFGDRGLAVAQLLLAIALCVSLQGSFGAMARDRFVGALVGAYSGIACFNHFTLRPQVLVWIFFAVVIAIADTIAREGVTRRRLILLGLVGAAWANSHLTAVLGLVAVFLWLVQPAAASVPGPALQASRGQVQWKTAAKASAAFFVGTLCTPYFGGEWLTFISKGGHPLKFTLIAEFQPATILQYSTIFVVLPLVLLVVTSFNNRRIPSLSRCALAGGMIVGGLAAVKFLPFAVITLSALISVWWREYSAGDVPQADHLAGGIKLVRERFFKLSSQTQGALAFFLVCLTATYVSALLRNPINVDLVPRTAVDFFETKQLSHPILNEFGAGGYLMYRFSGEDGVPRHTVAIDGRTNVNPLSVWEAYQAAFQGKAGWRRYLAKVNPKTIIWRHGSPLVAILFASKEWCRVFATGSRDNDFVMFVSHEEFMRRRSDFSSINCSDDPEPADSPPV
jgi:hypothetical protein